MLRTCGKCGTGRPLYEFSPDHRRTDGYKRWCDPCIQQYHGRPKPTSSEREWRRKYPERAREQWKRLRRKLRDTVLNGYGGHCTCCGETIFDFLSVEHLNNDGKAHRERCGGNYGVIRDIVRRGFPPEFTILCMNCNFAKSKLGVCPHVTVAAQIFTAIDEALTTVNQTGGE